jgi:hypothetical protein
MLLRVSIQKNSLRFMVSSAILLLLMSPALGTRSCCEGEAWLAWSTREQNNYVLGYMLGYSRGFVEGCNAAAPSMATTNATGLENDPLRNCRHKVPDFSAGSERFVQSITEFYRRYPSDREIYITEVIDTLASGLSIEQIHAHKFSGHDAPE